ncbi:hypothetical protein D3C71_1849330 [compost metagenome]
MQVEDVEGTARHVFQPQRRLAQHRKIGFGHGPDVLAVGTQGLVQADDEVEQVQVVLEEQFVLDVVDRFRLQRVGRHLGGGIAADEGEDL